MDMVGQRDGYMGGYKKETPKPHKVPPRHCGCLRRNSKHPPPARPTLPAHDPEVTSAPVMGAQPPSLTGDGPNPNLASRGDGQPIAKGFGLTCHRAGRTGPKGTSVPGGKHRHWEASALSPEEVGLQGRGSQSKLERRTRETQRPRRLVQQAGNSLAWRPLSNILLQSEIAQILKTADSSCRIETHSV